MAKESYKHKRRAGIVPGIILVLLGLIFLLNNYGITNVDIGRLWPLFLIVPGAFMLYHASEKK